MDNIRDDYLREIARVIGETNDLAELENNIGWKIAEKNGRLEITFNTGTPELGLITIEKVYEYEDAMIKFHINNLPFMRLTAIKGIGPKMTHRAGCEYHVQDGFQYEYNSMTPKTYLMDEDMKKLREWIFKHSSRMTRGTNYLFQLYLDSEDEIDYHQDETEFMDINAMISAISFY